jgi:hypothetical protein
MLLVLLGAGVAASLAGGAGPAARLGAFAAAVALGALASASSGRIALALLARRGWPAKRVYTACLLALSALAAAAIPLVWGGAGWRLAGLGVLAGALAVEVGRACRAARASPR